MSGYHKTPDGWKRCDAKVRACKYGNSPHVKNLNLIGSPAYQDISSAEAILSKLDKPKTDDTDVVMFQRGVSRDWNGIEYRSRNKEVKTADDIMNVINDDGRRNGILEVVKAKRTYDKDGNPIYSDYAPVKTVEDAMNLLKSSKKPNTGSVSD